MTSTSNNFNAVNFGARALSLVLVGQSLVDFTKGVMGSKFFESPKQPTVKKIDSSDSLAQRFQHIAKGCLYAIAAFALYSYNSETQGILQNCQHDFTKTEHDLGICKFSLATLEHELDESETSLAKLTGFEEQFNDATLVIQGLQSQILGNSTLVGSLNQTLSLCQRSVKEQETNLQQIEQTYLKSVQEERSNTQEAKVLMAHAALARDTFKREKEECESNLNQAQLKINQLQLEVERLTTDHRVALQERDGCIEAYNSTLATNLAQSYANGNLTMELKGIQQEKSELEALLTICNSSYHQIANENDEQGYKIGNLTQSLNQVNQEKSELESSLSTCNANYSQIAIANQEQGYQIGNLTAKLAAKESPKAP